ncbi:hypothetical protein GCM10010211_85310 [Streptomyces albospinus]|uniref:Uncharacterized protein n=1 Tax=Streptomyces albospinus TaxID=285515 RepID=A0ABQ2VPD6_9ACTN|nr:hypothetical protein [Streptomyces albospinus]GGV05313.1 hypothetical protein GCM10010211_85310 [Streptomyces albospinus]
MTAIEPTPNSGSANVPGPPSASAPPPAGEAHLLPLRTFVILISAVAIGTAAGVLSVLGGTVPAAAVLVGLCAGGGSLMGLNKIVS